MNIDISRVNLLEKDIEDWLYENPNEVNTFAGPVLFWIDRQYRLPSGIADLIGVTHSNMVVIVEIKNVAINKAAVLQVCRYAVDLQDVLMQRDKYPHVRPDGEPIICKVLVGPDIDAQTYSEARACQVSYIQFRASVDLELIEYKWAREHRDKVQEEIKRISYRNEWERFGPHIDDILDAMMEAEERAKIDGFPDNDDGSWNSEQPDTEDAYDKLMDAVMGESAQEDSEEPF